MRTLLSLYLSVGLLAILACDITYACYSRPAPKISYCDSSAGRNVITNGDYSSEYCTRRAVMNLQKFKGCCMWQGGVAKITLKGGVQCNDGSTSEICTLQLPHEKGAIY